MTKITNDNISHAKSYLTWATEHLVLARANASEPDREWLVHYYIERAVEDLRVAVTKLGYDLVEHKPDTIPAVTAAPGFDGRDTTAKPADVIEDVQWSR